MIKASTASRPRRRLRQGTRGKQHRRAQHDEVADCPTVESAMRRPRPSPPPPRHSKSSRSRSFPHPTSSTRPKLPLTIRRDFLVGITREIALAVVTGPPHRIIVVVRWQRLHGLILHSKHIGDESATNTTSAPTQHSSPSRLHVVERTLPAIGGARRHSHRAIPERVESLGRRATARCYRVLVADRASAGDLANPAEGFIHCDKRGSSQMLDQRFCGPSLVPLGVPGPVDDEESVDLG